MLEFFLFSEESFMALTKEPYRGTRDFFPKEKRIRDYLFSIMEKTAKSFGHESYDGPLLEEVELYKAKSGEELINEQIYSFTDRGERFMAIRPEMTPTLARMVAKVHRETPKPIRWFAIPNLMRYEKPQRGRVREHWQFNVDIFGAPDRLGEIEILQIVVGLFTHFNATKDQFEILLNDRAIIDCVFIKLMKVSPEITYKLYKLVDKSKKLTHDAFLKLLSELNLSDEAKNIFLNYLQLKTTADVILFLKNNHFESEAIEFENFIQKLSTLGLLDFITYDPTIVRGLDYYTGIVFEVFDKHPENRRALCGGGAYANLLQIFNEEPLNGVGFGLGDVTLRDFLETHKLLPNFDLPLNDLALTATDEKGIIPVMSLANNLRPFNIKVVTSLEPLSFKKIFPFAEKRGAKFVGIIGSNELLNQQIQIKNMATKEQAMLSLNDPAAIIHFIQKA